MGRSVCGGCDLRLAGRTSVRSRPYTSSNAGRQGQISRGRWAEQPISCACYSFWSYIAVWNADWTALSPAARTAAGLCAVFGARRSRFRSFVGERQRVRLQWFDQHLWAEVRYVCLHWTCHNPFIIHNIGQGCLAIFALETLESLQHQSHRAFTECSLGFARCTDLWCFFASYSWYSLYLVELRSQRNYGFYPGPLEGEGAATCVRGSLTGRSIEVHQGLFSPAWDEPKSRWGPQPVHACAKANEQEIIPSS